jgi:hypothetical protein
MTTTATAEPLLIVQLPDQKIWLAFIGKDYEPRTATAPAKGTILLRFQGSSSPTSGLHTRYVWPYKGMNPNRFTELVDFIKSEDWEGAAFEDIVAAVRVEVISRLGGARKSWV